MAGSERRRVVIKNDIIEVIKTDGNVNFLQLIEQKVLRENNLIINNKCMRLVELFLLKNVSTIFLLRHCFNILCLANEMAVS